MADPSEQQNILQEIAKAFAQDTGQTIKTSPVDAKDSIQSRILALETFEDFSTVLETYPDTLLVVDFVAKWYVPSQHFLGTFHDLSEQYPGVLFGIVDVDESAELCKKIGVSAPMFRIFQNKVKTQELSGLNVLGNPAEVEMVLRYEIEKTGAKKTDATINPVDPEIKQQTVKLAKPPNREKNESGSTGSIFDSPGDAAQSTKPTSLPASPIVPPQSKQAKIYQYFPQTEFLLWQSGNLATIRAKLYEFNDALTETESKLNDTEKSYVDEVVRVLEQENRYHASAFEKQHFQTLSKLLKWPAARLLPVLDIIRVALMHPHAADYFSSQPSVVDLLVSLLSPQSSTSFAIPIIVTRVLCNYFRTQKCRALLSEKFSDILNATTSLRSSANVPLQTSLSSLYLNFATMEAQCGTDSRAARLTQIIQAVIAMAAVAQNDDSTFRIIVAIGTAVVSEPALKDYLSKSLDIVRALERTSDKTKNSFSELEKLLA